MLTFRKKRKGSNRLAIVVTIAVFAAFVMFVIVMLRDASATSEEEEIRMVHESIVRAAVSCYSFEGFYPADIEYLVEHYNLILDRERFFIYYDRIAANILPNIIVRIRGGD
jgi:hypothetical protein